MKQFLSFFLLFFVYDLDAQCITNCNQNVGIFTNNNPESIGYDNMVSSFHSSLVSEENGYRIWGERMLNNGTGHALIPIDLNSINYPALTGTVYHVGLGSNSVNMVQLIVLTSNGLFASGVPGAVISTSIKNTTPFTKITVNGKMDGLPTGITPDSVKMMFVSFQTIIITTCGGRVFVLSQNTAVRGNISGSATQWSQVITNTGQPLLNIIATRGNSRLGYALSADNKLWTWGENVYIGNGTAASNSISAVEMTLPTSTPIRMIQATSQSSNHSYYAIDTLNNMYALGFNNFGQICDNTTTNRLVWVQARYSNGSFVNNAKWISANEHDFIYPNVAVINTNYNVFTAGNNNTLMIARTNNSGVNNLNLPIGINITDTITFCEVGGHTSAYIKKNTPRYGYVGHHINGSIGNNSSTANVLSSVNFIIPPVVNICGTICDTPILSKKPFNCNDSIAVFIIKGRRNNVIQYISNGNLDSVIIGNNDSAIIQILNPSQDVDLTIVKVNSFFCEILLSIKDTVKLSSTSDVPVFICKNSSVIINNQMVNQPGIYKDTLSNYLGCDSFINYIVSFKDTSKFDSFFSICSPKTIIFNNQTIGIPGIYKDTLVNTVGCDSFIYLHFSNNNPINSILFDTFCQGDSVLYNNIWIKSAGTYQDTIINSSGCFEYQQLVVFIRPKATNNIFQSICLGDTFRGKIVSGIYVDTFKNASRFGCDSLLIFNLEVLSAPTPSIQNNNTNLCPGQNSIIQAVLPSQFNYIYNWTTPAGYSNPGNINNFTTNVPGLYSLNVRTITSVLCNTDFEGYTIPTSLSFQIVSQNSVPCWKTTASDGMIELWKSGFIGVPSFSGNQFAELNANMVSTLYQEFVAKSGNLIEVSFAHRGRQGTDVMSIEIGKIGGPYVNLGNFSAGNTQWNYNKVNYLIPNNVSDTLFTLRFNSVSSAGGNTTVGNFLDAVDVKIIGCPSSTVSSLITFSDTTKKDSFLTICKNKLVVFNGISRNSTGIYRDTLVNSKGCDSFLYLHLTVNDTTKKDSFRIICKNQFVVFNGQTLNTSGIYKDTLVNSKGCDSFMYLHLTVNDTTTNQIFQTICVNNPILFNGILRNISGLYKDTLVNSKGCDSFVYLNLTVNDTTKKDSFLITCKNQPILFNGISRNISGIYRDTLVNTKGCDSFLYLHLTVNDTTKKDSFLIICKNQPILFNGISRNSTGIYRDTLVNSKGCDSFMYLHLTVNDTTKKDSFRIICKNQPILFNGILRNTSGLYKDTLFNSKGCDSFLYLHLTVNDTTTNQIFQTICVNNPILFNGILRNISGLYEDTLVNSKGCDSFVYLNLTVNDTTKKDSFLITCKNQPILFNGISRNISGIYRDTLVNSKGCDSFLYLHLTVNDTTKKDSFRIICKNQFVVFNGQTLNTTGIYKDTLLNAKGCDSFLYLHLTVNDTTTNQIFQTICVNNPILFNGILRNISGIYRDTLINAKGCDSFVYLNLTVNDTTKKDSFLFTCKNQPIIFNGISRNNTGIYRDTLVNSKGCDSFLYLHLTVNDTTKKDSFLITCKNQPIIFNGISQNTSGIYRDTLVNSKGCDSFMYLHLTVNDTTKKDSFLIICNNQPIIFNGISRNSTGIYRDTLVNSKGCDSFLYLHLTINDTTKKDSFRIICKNQFVVFNGQTLNTSGIYKDTLVNAKGCDSFLYLHLTVNDTTTNQIFQTICVNNPILFNGILRNTSGLYKDTLVNSKGCDSFVYLNLTVNDTPKKDSFLITCKNQPILFNGISRNSTGIYRDTLVNSKGCDSFLYLHLTVNDTTKKDSFLITCKNQPILFNGISRNTSGIYRDTLVNSKGCDSFLYLHLTVNDTTKKDSFRIICKNQFVVFNGQTLNSSGIYKDTLVNAKGCDSFLYLHLTVNDTTTNQIFQTICVNNPILFNGILRNTSGLYKDTLVNSKGCDSFVYLNLTVNDTTKKDSFLITCKNQPILFNGISRNNTGIYRDTLLNSKGCDSFLYLHLTVNDTTKKDSFLITCKNQPILFNGISRNNTGIFRDTLINSKGCDSFLYLHLTVNDTTKKDSFRIICKNQFVVFNGQTLNTTGIYKDTLINVKGCDSFLYLHLTVNDTTTNQIFQTICVNNPILFNGILRNTSGLYKDTLVNSKGCDSFVYLNLTVNDTTKKDSFFITCKNQPILFNGISRNNTGIYRDTLINAKGCDSFLYLHLTVNPVTRSLILDTICEGRTFLNYSQTGTYLDTFVGLNQFGCDSIREIRLFVKPTVRSFITETICFGDTFLGYFKTGIYIDTLINASAIGCDSIRTTTLIVRPVELLIYETICSNQYFEKYNQTGIYLDTIIDNFGCKRNRTLYLTVLESSSSYISQEICFHDKIYGYNKTGIYIDTLINFIGCDSIRTLDIIVRNRPLTPLKDTGICEGQRIVLNANKGFILYTWNDGTTKQELEIDQAGIYYLVVMDSFKCVDFDTILVSSYPTPTIKIITNDDLNNFEIGDRILFESNVEDNVSEKGVYNWVSSSKISCDTCENTFLNTKEENWLRVEYKSTNQCVAYDSIFFKKAGQLINIIEFPNSFSPNGDFLNDKFGPETKNVKNISWSVFNRWGIKVFESNSIYHFWDGIYKNEAQMSNLYYYTCEVEFNDGKKKSLKGELYLMR